MSLRPRRTQAERRAKTRSAIVDAAISALHDVGYAGTTIKEICARAGISQGGLFRHFDSRLDVIVAAADAVATRHAVAFAEAMNGATGDPLEAGVRIARERCHSPINKVWHEVMLTSRTDRALRDAVTPAAERHRASILGLAHALFGDQLDRERAEHLVWWVIQTFDGEALGLPVLGDPEGAEDRIAWVLRIVRDEVGG